MKGLLIKDLYCLKDQLKFFVMITVCVIYVGVLFILSAGYGNVAIIMSESDGGSEVQMLLYDMIMLLVLVLPIALGERVIECFTLDYKASFAKIFYTLPLSNSIKVASRYIVSLLYMLLGVVCSLFAGILIAVCSEQFTIMGIIRVIITLFACMLIYMSIVLCCSYYLGGKRSNLVSAAIFMVLFLGGYAYLGMQLVGKEEKIMDQMFHNVIVKIEWYINHATVELVILLLAGIIFMGISYALSVLALKRKTGTL